MRKNGNVSLKWKKKAKRKSKCLFNPPSRFPSLVFWIVLGVPGEQICAVLAMQSGGENFCFGGQAPEMFENHQVGIFLLPVEETSSYLPLVLLFYCY